MVTKPETNNKKLTKAVNNHVYLGIGRNVLSSLLRSNIKSIQTSQDVVEAALENVLAKLSSCKRMKISEDSIKEKTDVQNKVRTGGERS